MVSIYDIAREVGVSATTVSFVLNGKAEKMRISQKTSQKIRDTAARMGYIPNVTAKKLVSTAGESVPEIALLWSPVQNITFLNTFIACLQEMISKNQVRDMRFTIVPFRQGALSQFAAMLESQQYNGFVVPPISKPDIDFLETIETAAPIILLHGETSKFPLVSVDNYQCGVQAAELFHRHGHTEVVLVQYLYRNENSITMANRARGFLKTCERYNIQVEVQRAVNMETHKPNPAVGERVSEELLARDRLPTGVFVQNDSLAISMIHALIGRGVGIPGDMEVVAFGSSYLPEISVPTITTVDYPLEEISRASIQLMAGMLEQPGRPPARTLVPTTLIYRESCPETRGG